MTGSQKERMLAGKLYRANDPELVADNQRISAWMARYNGMLAHGPDERAALLREAFGHVGNGVNIRPPFYCDYGYNIFVGDNVFLNHNCVLLDCNRIAIGVGTQIGPNVQILAADHPRDPEERRQMLEFSRPVHIGANVWIGAGAIILPGVSIGDNAIIGAGSIVTRDVPPDTMAVGNPARIRMPESPAPKG